MITAKEAFENARDVDLRHRHERIGEILSKIEKKILGKTEIGEYKCEVSLDLFEMPEIKEELEKLGYKVEKCRAHEPLRYEASADSEEYMKISWNENIDDNE